MRPLWGRTLTGPYRSDKMTSAWVECARKHNVPKRIDPSPFHKVRSCCLLVKN